MKPGFRTREFTDADAVPCWQLFHDSVRRINCRDYTPLQIDAWTRDCLDREHWCRRFDGTFAYVIQHDESIVGFANMTRDGYVDRLFVSPDHQRQGIATLLMNTIEAKAKANHLPRIHTQASITAKPFFRSRGFAVVREQTVECQGVKMTNFVMELLAAT